MDYKYHYDGEYDVLAVYANERNVEESLEISENVVLDLDKNGRVNGIEIMDASEFLGAFNPNINKKFLLNLDFAGIECKSYRNQWIIVVVVRSEGKQFSQPMPPLRKSEYVSPILADNY